MRKFEKKEFTTTRDVCVKLECDICGTGGSATVYNDASDWAGGMSGVDETTVHYKDGQAYPDGGWGIEVTIDICPECFKNKLIPWVESQGGNKIEEKEWDY